MVDIASARPAAGAPVASDWGGQVHDALEGIQGAQVTVNGITTSNASLAIVFPRPYVAAPVLLVGGQSTVVAVAVSAVTASGFTLTGRRVDGNSTATNQPIYWMAIGVVA